MMNKIKIVVFGFLHLVKKVSGTYRVDLALKRLRDVVCKHFELLCLVFHGAAPIPYAQAATMNLLHP